MKKATKIGVFEAALFTAASWGLLLLVYKLLRAGYISFGLAVFVVHFAVFGFVLWLVVRGHNENRPFFDKAAAIVLGIWLIATWMVGLRL